MPRSESLGSYLDALASAAPTPGGGAAAAWTLAQAAALLAMVCRLTKADGAKPGAALRACLDDALAVQAASERLADLDSLAFQGYGAALKLPKEGPGPAGARAEALERALEEAAQVPLALHELASHVLGLGGPLRFLADAGNPRVLSDVGVAHYLGLAVLGASKENVRVNLGLFKDQAQAALLEQRLGRSEARALAVGSGENPSPQDGPAQVAEILERLPARLRGLNPA